MGEAAVMSGLDDPGPIQLDDLTSDDWALFGDESNDFDSLELLPEDFGFLDADPPNAAVSPASSLTQLSSGGGGTSSPTREESSGSGSENCKSDEERGNHSPASSEGSQKIGRIKRSNKRKISSDFDEALEQKEQQQEQQDEGEIDEEEMKRRARLMRNRESAQLSRQRKKAYVDDLEERVRTLNSTVAELNNTVALISAENVSLRSQLAYFYSNGAAAAVRPGNFPAGAPPPPPPVGMPMYPYHGGFTSGIPMRTAPAVPIPRLKTPASSVKSVKRAKISKEETSKPSGGGKPKKLAAVAALGLLCVMMVCLPLQWGVRPLSSSGGFSTGLSESSRVGGRVLMSLDSSDASYRQLPPPSVMEQQRSWPGGGMNEASKSKAIVDGSIFPASVSVTGDADGDRFSASLILPRDDKLVKLDGNLIVQAVMAGDKANTQVAVVKPDRFQSIVAEAVAREKSLPSIDQQALASRKDVLDDLAGAVLGAGVCREVFQFEVTPEEPAANNSSTRKRSGYHRRSLSAVPLPPLPTKKEPNNGTHGFQQPSSMVVSILTSPEAGSVKRDPKQVFVVVLLNSVKYVTYSCMLPLQPRVVTG